MHKGKTSGLIRLSAKYVGLMKTLANQYSGLSKRDWKLLGLGVLFGWAIAMTIAVKWNNKLRDTALQQGVHLK